MCDNLDIDVFDPFTPLLLGIAIYAAWWQAWTLGPYDFLTRDLD